MERFVPQPLIAQVGDGFGADGFCFDAHLDEFFHFPSFFERFRVCFSIAIAVLDLAVGPGAGIARLPSAVFALVNVVSFFHIEKPPCV